VDEKQQLQTALVRIAQLEERLSAADKKSAGIDPGALARDTVGTLQKHGIPIDHVFKVTAAHQMGDNAPEPLKAYALQGQQVSTTMDLRSQVESLRRGLDELSAGNRRESFKTLAGDKSKYPRLAAAMAADSALFDSDLSGHQGNPAELATRLEERLTKLGVPGPAPAASAESAGTAKAEDSAKDMNAKPAPMAGALSGNPPPIPQPKTQGILDADGYKALRDEIVQKWGGK
jgi:hypothetical protein